MMPPPAISMTGRRIFLGYVFICYQVRVQNTGTNRASVCVSVTPAVLSLHCPFNSHKSQGEHLPYFLDPPLFLSVLPQKNGLNLKSRILLSEVHRAHSHRKGEKKNYFHSFQLILLLRISDVSQMSSYL